jgi:hypothetical protein
MSRTTAVQVERVELITTLEERIKEIPKLEKEYDNARKEYDKQVKEWSIAIVADPSNFAEVNEGYYRDDIVAIKLTPKALKSKPKYTGPNAPELSGWRATEAIKEINNTVKILKMSKSELVGVSILNKVSQYL